MPQPLGPGDGDELAVGDPEVDVGERGHGGRALPVHLAEADRLQHRVHPFSLPSTVFAAVEPFEVSLQVQRRALDDERGRGVGVAVGEHVLEVAQRAEVAGALARDQLGGLGEPDLAGEDELHEEVVAQPRRAAGGADPLLERGPAGVGQAVDAPVAAALAGHVVLDELVALEPLQARVDLADVQRRDGAAEALLEPALDLVAVGGRGGEEASTG